MNMLLHTYVPLVGAEPGFVALRSPSKCVFAMPSVRPYTVCIYERLPLCSYNKRKNHPTAGNNSGGQKQLNEMKKKQVNI